MQDRGSLGTGWRTTVLDQSQASSVSRKLAPQLTCSILVFAWACFVPPPVNPQGWRVPLVPAAGGKGHAGKPEYATQEEAPEIRDAQQSERESRGKCFPRTTTYTHPQVITDQLPVYRHSWILDFWRDRNINSPLELSQTRPHRVREHPPVCPSRWRWTSMETTPSRCRRTSSASTATVHSEVATTSSGTCSPTQVIRLCQSCGCRMFCAQIPGQKKDPKLAVTNVHLTHLATFRWEAVWVWRVRHAVYPALSPGPAQEGPQWREALPVWPLPTSRTTCKPMYDLCSIPPLFSGSMYYAFFLSPFFHPELLENGPPPEAQAPVFGGRRGQGGGPSVLRGTLVLPGPSLSHGHVEPPTAPQQPPDRLTVTPPSLPPRPPPSSL